MVWLICGFLTADAIMSVVFLFRSSATRFRWIQNYYGEQDEWALDDIYIGQQCPNMCHGHGWCDHGHCRLTNICSIQGCRHLSKDVCVTHLNWFADFIRFAKFLSCRCDDGFTGPDCQPSSPLSSSVLSDFESQDALLATWQEAIGGEVVTPDMGCGVVSSGSSLYFSKVTHLPGKGFLSLLLLCQSVPCVPCVRHVIRPGWGS